MKKKNSKDIIPKEVMRGRETWLKRLIKSNMILYRFFYKLLRCNRYDLILRGIGKDTDAPFDQINIETCSMCNRRCSFCPVNQDKTPKRMMPDELFDKVEQQLKELNFQGLVGLNNYGEPLLDKRLSTFVKRIKKLNCQIIIDTNGDFLTKEKFRELVDAGANMIYVSQHDLEPSETIKNLFAQISPAEWKYISYGTIEEGSIGLTNRGGLVKVNTLYPFYCNLKRITVRADGNVSFCCNDYYNEVALGNINEKKLIDIWNSPFYRKIRNEIKRGVFNLEFCKRCRGIIPPKKHESKG